MGEYSDRDYNPDTLPVTRCLEKLQPTRLLLNLFILNCRSYFLELKQNEWILDVTVSMIIGKSLQRLLFPLIPWRQPPS